MFTGIRRKLIIYYLVVIAVIVILMGAFFIFFLNYFYMQTLRENLNSQARLASALVEEMLARNANYDEIDQFSKDIGNDLGVRVTLVAVSGTVLADSDEDPERMENHNNRPEIIAAKESGQGIASRHSETLDEEMYYLAIPLSGMINTNSERETAAIIRLALPLATINGAILNLVLFILGALLLSSVFALVTAIVFSQRITGPISEISNAAHSIAEGNYNPSLEVPGRDELSLLAQNIKEMGQALGRKIEQVMWEKNKIETVVASMSSGIILTDHELNIELINPAAEELFDLKRAEVIGEPFNRAIRYYALNENLKALCSDGEARVMEVNLYYPRAAVLDTYLLPVSGKDQKIIGALILFHETTELRSLEKMRSDFVANASHELRTPLTAIRGYTETILHEELTRDQLFAFLQVIDKETRRLSYLLDDLLDLAQIENEKGFVKKEPVDLTALAGEAVQRVEDLRKSRGTVIKATIPGDPIYISGNSDWLQQALVNILENSIRHGYENGTIEVAIYAEERHAVVEISDDGPGISEVDLPFVFERFYRADKARSRKSGGTGLGLSIVKHIMVAHDSNYTLQSKAGEGTIFRFTLALIN